MNTHLNADLLRSLRAARRRLRTQYFFNHLVLAILAGAFLLLVVGLVRYRFFQEQPLPAAGLLGALILAVVGAGLTACCQTISLLSVAQLLDRLGQTRDRFLTALHFSETPNAFEALAAQECNTFLAGRDFSPLIVLRCPRAARYLLVPLAALLLLQWQAQRSSAARHLAAAVAQQEAAPTAEQLEKLARELEKNGAESEDDELKKIAEQLKRSAERLRAEKTGAAEAAKTALRELSRLEQLLQESQQSPASVSPEELRKLAEALAKNAATENVAKALEAGKLAEAAQQLEAAAEQPNKEETEKILREALQRLAEQQKSSQALQQLAQQMQQGGEGDKTLQQLAQLLRQMAKQPGGAGQPGQPGQPSSKDALKQLLAALQNMKAGEGNQSPGPNAPPQGEGKDGKVSVQSFAGKPGEGEPEPTDSGMPSGRPGGERDPGTTATPFGKELADQPDRGQESALKGRLGAGETLSQLLPSAGDTSKSQRRYKELYDAMAPAAQDAVLQENIPLGSRFFIKRYFENIRPKE